MSPERPNIPYEGSKLNGRLQIVNLLDLEPEAQKIRPSGGFGYISGGSGNNWTRRENTEAFSRVNIEPQALSGVAKVDLTTEILGSKLSMPVFIPPMGSHGLAHVYKEAATSRAPRGRNADDDLDAIQPQHGGDRLPQSGTEVVPDVCAEGPRLDPRNDPARQGCRLHRARADSGQCLAYPREENIRSGFGTPASLGKGNPPRNVDGASGRKSSPPEARPQLGRPGVHQAGSGLPVIAKGVQSAKSRAKAVEGGMDAVWVSNHGGRAFDGVQATICTLPRIVDAVDGRMPIVFEAASGAPPRVQGAGARRRRGGMGRPVLYGLALGGSLGAQSVLEYLRDNLALVMRLAGTSKIDDITTENLVSGARHKDCAANQLHLPTASSWPGLSRPSTP